MILWDAGLGTGPFAALIGDSTPNLDLSQLITDSITSGTVYTFKYLARNIHGDGIASDPFEITAATEPTQMGKPTVTLETGLKYRVSFEQPNTGGSGVAITEYSVLFRKSDGTFEAISECDGTAQAVLDNLYCEADLSSLTDATTFNL